MPERGYGLAALNLRDPAISTNERKGLLGANSQKSSWCKIRPPRPQRRPHRRASPQHNQSPALNGMRPFSWARYCRSMATEDIVFRSGHVRQACANVAGWLARGFGASGRQAAVQEAVLLVCGGHPVTNAATQVADGFRQVTARAASGQQFVDDNRVGRQDLARPWPTVTSGRTVLVTSAGGRAERGQSFLFGCGPFGVGPTHQSEVRDQSRPGQRGPSRLAWTASCQRPSARTSCSSGVSRPM